ncbi:MAG: hypothetical protein N2385_14600 [Chloroflexus sp.]|nr:hypothetical protein [Chloroflexus sp.]
MSRYRYLYRLALDHCSLDEIRAAQDTARRWRLPAIYWCDALSRMLARRDLV